MNARDEMRRDAPPAELAARIAGAAAPELDALAARARRRSVVAVLVLLGVPTLVASWQFALLAARPGPPAQRPDARWLAQRVGPDGRFAEPEGEPRATPVGLHGLALLALARTDIDTDAAADRAAVARAADWLLAQQAPDGALADADQDHALATLALVEAWRCTQQPLLRAGAERALAALLEREAWGARVDDAAAAWSLQALLAAQDAGLAGDAAAAMNRTRARLAAALGSELERGPLDAALSPRAAPRQASLGPLYVASVALLASAAPVDPAR